MPVINTAPTLKELPPPPPGKFNWPWTEESCQLADVMPDGRFWPKISIVTPSYNQGQFLEETIRSVLLQGYPNLEYIIIDGGSTDDSVEIIKKYDKYLAYRVSELDRGQSHAINKGFAQATGSVLAWLNSDDFYEPDTLNLVGEAFASDLRPMWAAGAGRYIDTSGGLLYVLKPQTPSTIAEYLSGFGGMSQPASFWHRLLWKKAGGELREDFHYCMDEDLWIRFALVGARPHVLDATLCVRRIHEQAKTSTNHAGFVEDMTSIVQEYSSHVPPRESGVWRQMVAKCAGSYAEGGVIDLRKGELRAALRIFYCALKLSPLGAISALYIGVCRRTRRLLRAS